MKKLVLIAAFCLSAIYSNAQVDLKNYKPNGAKVVSSKEILSLSWPAGKGQTAKIDLDLTNTQALFKELTIVKGGKANSVASSLDPTFILRVGSRTLSPNSGGWDVFFDRVPTRPYQTHLVKFEGRQTKVTTQGTRTTLRIGKVTAPGFNGALEITVYNGSPLFNIAAVISTAKDSTAILYDAGLVSRKGLWKNVAYANVQDQLQKRAPNSTDAAANLEVKYRSVIGESNTGSLAVFPAPHQYFYPLDEAFNLKFTWAGHKYLDLVDGYGIGIRQDPIGDKRYVPWFNAPPNTQQRLNFFCLMEAGKAEVALNEVKKFTHDDSFKPLAGYQRMASHFHNEFISDVVLARKPVPEKPEFVDVLKKAGLDIVKLAEFHGPGHPKGPDSVRLKELKTLFEQTERLSDDQFLLLPGEEANNFYGGHWLAFFPKPVYWVMSRKPDAPFETQDPKYGKVYHVGDQKEMLKLLEQENGLAWVAHARTKGSTGYPDKYKEEDFFKSPTYFGAAWKAIPADLSIPTLSQRVLKLLDDMANWGYKKHALAEADIFTITHQNEMYAHLNVNYLQMDKLPKYKEGWQPVLDVLNQGKFFVSTGEVLIPTFSLNGKASGETLKLGADGKAVLKTSLDWTFPMNFVDIVISDGKNVTKKRIDLSQTQAFGKQDYSWNLDLKGKKWLRLEAWDIAANGAFTQMIWLD